MALGRHGIRWPVALLAVAALVAAAVVGLRWIARDAAAPAAPEQAPAVAAAPPLAPPEPAPAPPAEQAEREPHPPELAPETGEMGFETIDLEAAREALPDNLYWETAAPTQDPRLLGDRERAKTHWNEQYGKMLSGTGSEEEIKAYFDRRMQLSSDYVRFVDWVLEHQGDELSEQDLKLLHLARRLHLARLQEVPKRMQEAYDRKAQQDAAREAWLAEERELQAADSESREGEPDSE